MTAHHASVDVVIVTKDNWEMLERCVERLADPAVATVAVVDNGSTQQPSAPILGAGSLIRLDEDAGLARAFNVGANEGTASHILFLNDDIFATPGAISRVVDELKARPAAGSAGGRLVEADGTGRTQDRYRPMRFPTLGSFVMGLTGLDRLWPANPWSGNHLRHPVADFDTVEVDQPAGACLLVRRDVFDEIGGWDEGFWVWYEDVDISRRLAGIGPAIFVASAPFEHVGGSTARKLNRAELLVRTHHGIVRYAAKHFSRASQIALAALLVALSAPWLLYFRDRTVVRARLAVIRAALLLAATGRAASLRSADPRQPG